MGHLRRALVLLIVPVVAVIAFPWIIKSLPSGTGAGLVAQRPPWVLVPSSFGEFGRFRGDNVQEWTSLAPRFAPNTAACAACHQSNFQAWSQGVHQGLSCQTCHGTRANHIQGRPEPTPPAPELAPLTALPPAELCSRCHDAGVVGKPKDFPTVEPALHSRGVACTLCHNPHSPRIGGGR